MFIHIKLHSIVIKSTTVVSQSIIWGQNNDTKNHFMSVLKTYKVSYRTQYLGGSHSLAHHSKLDQY